MFLCSFSGIVVGHERDVSCVVVWGHEERERKKESFEARCKGGRKNPHPLTIKPI
jgi:hypothetical protein